jgi:hypothetical protein
MAVPLKGTRHIVKWKAAAILVVFGAVLIYPGIETTYFSQTGQSQTSSFTITSVTGATSLQRSTTTAQTESSTLTTTTSGVTCSGLTNSVRPTVSASGIAEVNRSILSALINRSQVCFSLSSTSIPYIVVTDAKSNKPIGLAYLTTDVAPSASWGYSGPIGVLVYVNATGTIEGVRLWTITDTWEAYPTTVQVYLNRFVNRSVFDPLQIGNDIQGITSATYTSNGIASGIRDAGRIVVEDFENNYSSHSGTGQIGNSLAVIGIMESEGTISSLILLGLFCCAVTAFWRGSNRVKYGVFAAAILYLGLLTGRMVSISDFPIFLMARLPPFDTNMFWYVLYGGTLFTSLLWGRLYCGYLCPFGAVTEILHKASPLKLKMPHWANRRLVYLKYVVLGATLLLTYAAIGGMATAAGFQDVEPFLALFLSVGDILAFVFLGAVLVASVFFERFYCSYICPAGAGLSLLGWFRVSEIRRWGECSRCGVCEADCPTGAISHGKISPLECMDCRRCEVNFLNSKICPHYAVERIAS